MVLEAVMICLDNSEWMRNGDFYPSREKSQAEAVNTIALGKTHSNPESTVGILAMARRVQVLMTPGRDLGRLMNELNEVKIGGDCNFIGALKTAALALKNRQNKNQAQRIVLFVGSPVDHDKNELVKIGKVFKKNNVAIDVINFGAENGTNENTEKLEALIGAVQTNGNSHLVNIPHNPMMNLSDIVLTSTVMQEAAAVSTPATAAAQAGPAGSSPAASQYLGGVDPNLDPELAMALRLSMEEERNRQQASSAGSGSAPSTSDAPAAVVFPEEEDPMLAQAIALSLAADGGDVDMGGQDVSSKAEAMEVSAPKSQPQSTPAPASSAPVPASDDIAAALQDREFLDNLLQSVGVDRQDVQVDDILGQMAGDNQQQQPSQPQPQQGKDKAQEDKDKDKNKPKDPSKDPNKGN